MGVAFAAVRPSTARTGDAPMSIDKIEHVVVLMLENRSFDSLLGWLYQYDAPSQFIPASPGAPFRGLQDVKPDDFTNTALNGTLTATPTRGVQGFSVPTADPGEEYAHVTTQFYNASTPGPGAPNMKGVLADYVGVLQGMKFGEADVRRLAQMVMESHSPGQLPVLNQLAKHYAVSDAWYASVPSQTNPNRSFLMCGTSNGMVNNGELETNPLARALEAVLGMAIGDDRVESPTIFNALQDAGADWKVFWQTSYLPQKISTLLTTLPQLIPFLPPPLSIVAGALLTALSPFSIYIHELASGDLRSCYTWRLFPEIQKIPNAAWHFHKLEDFHRMARAGQLPKFSYIEPFWTIAHTTNPDVVFKNLVTALGNDYHPPSNLLVGEQFVKEVYTSLISNKAAWAKTLLLITFDEFVGCFDHVTEDLKPGVVTPPWGPNGKPPYESPTKFKFDRLGARVPTILISPYVQKGTVFRSTTKVPYDHTSMIATTMKWLGRTDLSKFGRRTEAAPTFEGALTLSDARTDEADLAFLDTPRHGDKRIRYGDSIRLKNQSGEYLSSFYCTMKVGGGGSVLPAAAMGIAVDLGVAANFPRVGQGAAATLAFYTRRTDPPDDIRHGDQVLLVSREAGLGPYIMLGAWKDSHDCYYANEYLDGDPAAQETWTIEKLNDQDKPLASGDQVYLVNKFFGGQRLTRDQRWLVEAGWITTAGGGDYWTVELAPPQVG
jgi:phospholipase C